MAFYRNVITVEVISDRELTGMSVEEIVSAMNYGDCVGITDFSLVELSGKETADALYEFGSEPAFFGLDDDGVEI